MYGLIILTNINIHVYGSLIYMKRVARKLQKFGYLIYNYLIGGLRGIQEYSKDTYSSQSC